MFDIGTKIKRAWNTIWRYKVLWIFVFLMALTGAAGNGGGSGGGGSSSWRNSMGTEHGTQWNTMHASMPAWLTEIGTWFETDITPLFMPDRLFSTILWMMLILIGVCLLFGLIGALVRYPAETAVLRMVNDYEETGTKVKFKEGWKLGWNHRAFRLWLVDLIVGAPAFVVVIGMLVGVALFVSKMIGGETLNQIPGMIGLIILAAFLLFVLTIFMIFVGIWREYISRAIAIDGATVGEGFKQGWAMIAHNFKNTFLTWLVMLGIGIAFGIAVVLVFFVLIPVFAVMTIPGTLVGAIPAGIAYGISSIFASGPLVWVIAALVFIGFFFTVVFSPLTLLSGLYLLFGSSIWTQTYREMKRDPNQPPSIPMPVQ